MSDRTPYRRLPVTAFGVLTKSTAWIGPDHLLIVRSMRFTEEYQRFYYGEIQALILREKQGMGLVWETLIAVVLINLLVLAYLHHWVAIFFLPAAVAYGVEKLRGPRCAAQIKTATGLTPLPAFSRMRAARKAVALLRPRIEEAQGVLDPAALEGLLGDSPGPAGPPPLPAPSRPEPGRRTGRLVYGACFGAAILGSAAGAWYLNSASPASRALFAALYGLAVVGAILALARYRGTPVRSATRWVCGLQMGLILLEAVAMYGIMVFYSVIHKVTPGELPVVNFHEFPKISRALSIHHSAIMVVAVIGLALAVWPHASQRPARIE